MKRNTFQDILDRLEPITESGCHIWMGATTYKGYGYANYNGRHNQPVHQIVYEVLVGPIPDGFVPDHLCRVRCCANIHHLEVVTVQENTRRGESPTANNARKTHCHKGHEFTPDNIYVKKNRSVNLARQCKECCRLAGIERRIKGTRRKNKQALSDDEARELRKGKKP